MSEHIRTGRHRSAARYSPLAEITAVVRTAGESGARASAVLAASGGLVASFALPAQAAATPGAAAAAIAEQPASAPVAPATAARTVTAPALVAPTSVAPVKLASVGISGITAVKKPKPKPKPKPEPAPVVEAVQAPVEAPNAPAVADVQQSASGVVGIARTLLGIPYLYGGTSPSTGFDCSGFTSYVFGKAGISLPRTAAEQQAAATPVSDPQPGDLVFFGSPAWHVGIYTGGGMMIDSPKPGESTSERPVFDGVSGYGRF